jgi:hypothetical protein
MTPGDWSWPPELDGVIVAPNSHRVLVETPAVRVLELGIEPEAGSPSTPTATGA